MTTLEATFDPRDGAPEQREATTRPAGAAASAEKPVFAATSDVRPRALRLVGPAAARVLTARRRATRTGASSGTGSRSAQTGATRSHGSPRSAPSSVGSTGA